MSTLDSVLNFVIPFLIISGMIFLIYKAAKEPIDQFARWIKSLIQSATQGTKEGTQDVYSEIIYD